MCRSRGILAVRLPANAFEVSRAPGRRELLAGLRKHRGRLPASFRFDRLVAAALLAGSTLLYSEDMQHGQLVDRQLRILNPFRAA